ncbi:MAG TPA: ABC transporter permease [Phototrophicaceae bacterium]|nr:ABC transporter permease [Phototrophicaceae bacterium]
MATATQTQTGVITLQDERREPQSMTKVVIRRFFKHRMAVAGVVLLGLIMLYVTVGAVVFSEDYANQTSVRNKFDAPTAEHIFGTDSVGRDVLARSIYGGQISLAIGVIAMLISISVGTVVGLVAGYFGGLVDALLMRLVEAILTIPLLILLLLLSRALMEISASTTVILGREISVTVVVIVLIIGLTSWTSLSRIVRSMVLSLKEQEFIVAARALGADNSRIIFGHILPNCLAPILVSATLNVGVAIVVESALSFLGFGVMPPTATWGNILNGARQSIDDYWWLWMAPGALIMLTVLAINFVGDGLRDAFDPHSMR